MTQDTTKIIVDREDLEFVVTQLQAHIAGDAGIKVDVPRIDKLNTKFRRLLRADPVSELVRQVEAVRALHHRDISTVIAVDENDGMGFRDVEAGSFEGIVGTEEICGHCLKPWPCATIRAIDGR